MIEVVIFLAATLIILILSILIILIVGAVVYECVEFFSRLQLKPKARRK